MDEELLISLVESYRELYDVQHPHYDDNLRRNHIWDGIGAAVQKPGQQCRERWRRIRDNYRRAKKLRKTKSGERAVNMKTPKYDKILSFLTPYLESDTATETNLPPTDSTVDEDDCHSNSSGQPSNSSAQPLISSVQAGCTTKFSEGYTQPSASYYIRRKSQTGCSDEVAQTLALLKQYFEKKNPIVNFFTNLGETVAEFPEDVQVRVKREVFRIVSEAEEQEVCKVKRRNP